MMRIGKAIEQVIKASAIEEFPNEACGIITKKGKKMHAVKCKNVSDSPESRFVIATEEYRSFVDSTGVYGIWHTHVNDAKPNTASATDVAACNATGVDWIIIDVDGEDESNLKFGEFFFITPKLKEDESYIGRNYIYGVRDCFTLAVDYYKREFNVDISFRAIGYPEITDWQYRDISMLMDNYKEAGFVKLLNEEAKVGDLFLIQMSTSIPDHIAIYIGNDRILHHCYGRLSNVDIYGGGYWQKHTACHLRWGKFMENNQ